MGEVERYASWVRIMGTLQPRAHELKGRKDSDTVVGLLTLSRILGGDARGPYWL